MWDAVARDDARDKLYTVSMCAGGFAAAGGRRRRLSDESTSMQLFFQTAPTAVAVWGEGGAATSNATAATIYRTVAAGVTVDLVLNGSASFDHDGALEAWAWAVPASSDGALALANGSAHTTTLAVDAGTLPLGTHPIVLTVTDAHDEPDDAAIHLTVAECPAGLPLARRRDVRAHPAAEPAAALAAAAVAPADAAAALAAAGTAAPAVAAAAVAARRGATDTAAGAAVAAAAPAADLLLGHLRVRGRRRLR